MGDSLKVVGERVAAVDAFAKVTGRAEYCTNIRLPQMLVGKVLRSPHAHARVVRVDGSKAEALPGVKAVVTRGDVPRKVYTYNVMTYQLPDGEIQDMFLFDYKVRYLGDPVAAVAAVNEQVADEALKLIEVEYEPLPAAFNVEDAVKPGVPKLHEFAEGNTPVPATPVFCYGDVEKGMKEADAVVEGTFSTTKQIQAGLEPACAVADFKDGRLTVWSQTQLPHMARKMLAYLFDLPESKVRVIQPFAGTGFGAGTDLSCEPYCCALAIKAGAPVKVLYSRSEDFANRITREHICKIDMKIGLKNDGTPLALTAKYTGDAGAYMGKTASGCGVALASNITEYSFESMHQEIQVIYTNHVACGAMRGFGAMQSSFARETLIDEACEKIGMDPVEFRMKYHRDVGGLGWFPGTAISSCGLDECLRIGAEKIGWKEKKGKNGQGIRRRGVGVACMGWLSGAQPMLLEHTNAILKFNEDGGCSLFVSPGNMGQGILGTLAQIAAEVLGLDYEDINVIYGDTDLTAFDIGTHASRGVYCIGRAVKKAAEQARAEILQRASVILDAPVDQLEMVDKKVVVKGKPERSATFLEISQACIYNYEKNCKQIVAHATLEPTEFAPPWQAGFAEVEVDTETGVVRPLNWITVHDIGKAINPIAVEGQLEGGTAQGIGFALYEDTVITHGKVLSDGFDKYRIPSTLDLPDHEAILVELGDPTGPFGAKSCGESGLFLQAPAIANAVYDAVGVRIRDLPITPERILAALKKKETS
ncbi:MAG: molybdopterin cofactor-binding domain-containing protein [Pseudomonadota bacterium]